MKRYLVVCILSLLYGLFSSSSQGQDAPQMSVQQESSGSSVLTGDTLGGIKYFIKIVPHDTTTDEKMPMYKPGDTPESTLVDHPPVPIKRVQAEYPEDARSAKIEGTVWVVCLVGKDGRVQKTKLARADAEVFVGPAIEAAKQWLFSPAMLKGKAVDVWVSIPFRFKLGK